MHRNYIGAIERGEINATYGTLRRISQALDIPLGDLIDEAENPELRTARRRRRRR